MQLKKLLRAGKKYLCSSEYRFLINAGFGLYNNMPDEKYLKKKFRACMGKELNLDNPQTFNEKLQWLKLYDRKPEYTIMVDKFLVKKFVSDIIGEEYVIPTLGIWDRFEDIDFGSLPEQFVLKCTHDCGSVLVCRDKSGLNKNAAKAKFERAQGRNYYYSCREWPYKDAKPRILAEKFMQDADHRDLPVYKIFNFAGEPRLIQVIQNDKTKEETVDYFDPEWNLLDLRQNYLNSCVHLKKPEQLEHMLQLARKLSAGFPFIRTDLYVINGKIYFSEYTFYSDAGFAVFKPESWDLILGNWIDLC